MLRGTTNGLAGIEQEMREAKDAFIAGKPATLRTRNRKKNEDSEEPPRGPPSTRVVRAYSDTAGKDVVSPLTENYSTVVWTTVCPRRTVDSIKITVIHRS
jgi:hypothetical protein